MPTILGLETYSSAPLPKCGVYRYTDAPDFEVLLFSYAFDDDPVVTVDMACGEEIPAEVISALKDSSIIKCGWNSSFERVCLSKYLGYWLDPHQWRCSMVEASYQTLPLRLGDAAIALNVSKKKMDEGKDLIRYFSVPCKPTETNGGRTRNLPEHAPEKWALYKKYNAQDVETERAIRKELMKNPLPEHEWELYALDQIINDRGVRIDKALVKKAMAVDAEFTERAYARARELTGLENPGSVNQLKAWLADNDVPMESLAKKLVQEKASVTQGLVGELLKLRLELSKTSIKKYESMARCVCGDGRIHGMLQFGGASRTMRWSGRLVQLQNVPANHLADLDLAREIVKKENMEQIEMLYGSVPNTLSELIRTALIPKDGHRFIVCDFSAIEARVLAWLAEEEWVLEEFRSEGKIYEATASRMYHIPQETIVKGHPNYEYRQKGKQACLSCGYGGGVGALKAMGATMPEEEMRPLVDAWRAANPRIVKLWSTLDRAARHVTKTHEAVRVGKVRLYYEDERMFMWLPSGRNLCYISPRIVTNRFGSESFGFLSPMKNGRLAVTESWGATLVENITQSIARDLLGNGMLNLEAGGYHIVFDVHDEAVMEMPNGVGTVEEASRLMCQNPNWALDLPLKAAGYECLSYRKD